MGGGSATSATQTGNKFARAGNSPLYASIGITLRCVSAQEFTNKHAIMQRTRTTPLLG
jgi:hypothetical protein